MVVKVQRAFICQKMRGKGFRDITTANEYYAKNMTAEQRLAFRQIFKTTAKELVWDFKSDTCDFLICIRDEIFPENWVEIVDPNRDYSYNKDLLSDWENKERNDKACEWQNNFKFLEQIDNNKLVVGPLLKYSFDATCMHFFNFDLK